MSILRTTALSVLLISLSLSTLGQTPSLVKEIFVGPSGSFFQGTFDDGLFPVGANVNGHLFFVAASEQLSNYEYYSSDGTESGTDTLRDFGPGIFRSGAEPAFDQVVIQKFGNNVIIVADSVGERTVWKSDGTSSGTLKLYDREAIVTGSQELVTMESIGKIIHTCRDAASSTGICISDGDVGVAPEYVPVVSAAKPLHEFYNSGDNVYFQIKGTKDTLWVTDGTSAGTRSLNLIGSFSLGFHYDGFNYFSFDTSSAVFTKGSLWRTDGTVPGTSKVIDSFAIRFAKWSGPDPVQRFGYIEYKNKMLVFAQLGNDVGLVQTDGTPTGTRMLRKNIEPIAFCKYRDKVYFSAEDSLGDIELWVTDGTPGGTELFYDIFPGFKSIPKEIQTVGNGMIFTAAHPTLGRELFISDGTVAGTQVMDLRSGPAGSEPSNLMVTDSAIYFFAWIVDTLGYELYKMPIPLVDTGVSIVSHSNQSGVVVYPNPATNTLYLESESQPIGGITIHAINGREILTKIFREGQLRTTLDIAHIPKGVYVLSIDTGNEVITDKLVITH